jgi:hypothetical protein
MECRTGDILIWRSTNFRSILSEVFVGIKGLHSGLILVGDKFEQLSDCGKSPSNIYVTFLIDKIFPIEEVVGRIWTGQNGSSLYHIRRTEGPNINPDSVIKILKEINTMEYLSWGYTVYISLLAFFKWGDVAPEISYENKKWQLCSLFVEYLLYRIGLISEDAVLNNILPIDFYNLKFYQKYPYEKIEIFDKGTYEIQSWFNGFFINAGIITPEFIHHPIVENIMGNYNYVKPSLTEE